jgi:hypothetical protein
MADEADLANDNIARDEALAIKYAASRPPEAEATGFCLHCEVELFTGKRWCNADCRDAWEFQRRTHRR